MSVIFVCLSMQCAATVIDKRVFYKLVSHGIMPDSPRFSDCEVSSCLQLPLECGKISAKKTYCI